MTIKVTHFSRKPGESAFSMERLFTELRKAMPVGVDVKLLEMPFYSQGFFKRLSNILFSFLNQSQVNHIVGDIQYVNILMNKNKTILTIHDCVSIERLKGLKRWIFIKLWYAIPIKRSAIVTVISESTKKEVLKYVNCPEDKIKIIRNCIAGDFKYAPKIFSNDCPILLHIGTGDNKNLLNHIKAIKDIPCRLVVVGKLKDQQLLALKEANINYDNFIGLSDQQIIEQYERCDILLFCSTYEGFGLPIIEANAVGRPVLTSNVYSMPEVASDAAYIVDPFNIESIKLGVEKIIMDQVYREQLIKNGLQNARKYTQKSVAEEYAKLYVSVAKN